MSKGSFVLQKACLKAFVAAACVIGWVGTSVAVDYEAEAWTISASSPAAAAVTGQAGSSGSAFVCFNSVPTSAGTYYIELTTPSLAAGTYSFSYLYKGHANRGIFQVSVDGVTVGGLGDQYAASQTNQMNMNVGNVTLATSGTHRIRWTTNSKNASSSGYQTAIDRITLTASGVPTYTLTATAVNGTVTKSPDAASYAAGTVVTLTATANSGYTFTGWSGGVSGTANPVTVTMNSNISITANFTTPTTYTLTTSAVNGTVTKSPNASSYAAGTVVTLTATASSGYIFTGWSGGASGTTNPVTVTMNSNISVTANFTTPTTYSITIGAANGTVTKSPNASSYTAGTVVTLTASPNSGYAFSSWSGDVSGNANPTTVTMNANKSVVANFSIVTPPGSGGAVTYAAITSPVTVTSDNTVVLALPFIAPAAGHITVVVTGLYGTKNPYSDEQRGVESFITLNSTTGGTVSEFGEKMAMAGSAQYVSITKGFAVAAGAGTVRLIVTPRKKLTNTSYKFTDCSMTVVFSPVKM